MGVSDVFLFQGVNQMAGLLEMWIVRRGAADLCTRIGPFAKWRCQAWAFRHGYGWLHG